MSSFYDDASLVLIPSGYKASKIYSQKPTSGAGDFVATRASNATRVAANGLIEEVRTNLVLQSEAFNTTWAAGRGSVTANATTAPNGTTTADKFVADTQPSSHFVSQTISGLTSGGIYTSSVYAKAAEWNSVAIFRGDSAIGVSFRLDTQATTILNGTPTTFSITSVGNGWFRCSVSFAIASTSDSAQVRVGNDGAYSIAGNNVNGVFLWGAQYEVSDFGATDYIPTTTTSVSVGPTNNVPRLDYLNSTCPRLLLEPQRTNLFTFSEQFNNAAWPVSSASVTANSVISPSGYMDADLINSSGSTGLVYQVKTLSGVHTISAYFKAGTSVLARLQFYDSGVTSSGIGIFNLSTLTVNASGLSSSGTITNCGSGWYRCTLTSTLSGSSINCFVGLSENAKNVYAWGAQLEAGAYATSYIPSLNSTTTRVGDYASNSLVTTNANWTLLVDTDFVPYSEILNLYFVTSTGRFVSFYQSFDYFRIVGNAGAGVFAGRVMSDNAGRKKVVLQNDGTDCIVFVNGVRLGAINPAGASPLTGTGSAYFTFYGGGSQVATIGKLREFLQFNTKLTDAQCIELTTI